MKKEKEVQTLTKFIEIYCRQKHNGSPYQACLPAGRYGMTGGVCSDCENLLTYAKKRFELCPYDPKPKCRDCKTHCYAPAYRDKIKKVMRFSGMYMVKHGRLDYLFSHFFRF